MRLKKSDKRQDRTNAEGIICPIQIVVVPCLDPGGLTLHCADPNQVRDANRNQDTNKLVNNNKNNNNFWKIDLPYLHNCRHFREVAIDRLGCQHMHERRIFGLNAAAPRNSVTIYTFWRLRTPPYKSPLPFRRLRCTFPQEEEKKLSSAVK